MAEIFGVFAHDLSLVPFAKSKRDIRADLNLPQPASLPRPQTTIVLVGGLHGAIFANRVWSRFAAYCESTLKLRCLLIAPNGRGGCRENADFEILPALRAETAQQEARGLTPRFALIGYSKGGLDCLHLIKRQPEFTRRYISTLLTVASPLQGARSARLKVPFAEWWAEPMASDSRPDVKAFQGLADLDPRQWTSAGFWRDFHPPAEVKLASVSFRSSFFRTHLFLMLSFLLAEGPTDGAVELRESRFPDALGATDLGVIHANHLVALPGNEFQDDRQIGEVLVQCLDYIDAVSRGRSSGSLGTDVGVA